MNCGTFVHGKKTDNYEVKLKTYLHQSNFKVYINKKTVDIKAFSFYKLTEKYHVL
jgi:hypothetical protein